MDAAKVAWEMRAPVPQPRTEVSAATLDGKIYLIGGFAKEGVTARVEMYDPATDRWTSRASMPVALHHAGAAVLNGKLYVVGGLEGDGHGNLPAVSGSMILGPTNGPPSGRCRRREERWGSACRKGSSMPSADWGRPDRLSCSAIPAQTRSMIRRPTDGRRKRRCRRRATTWPWRS
ncbi:MAG: hypothetical protein MPW17_17030 [Candidatus Manganitrophus sp.]|nr:MAG: hypothetical protein MPW17_17030 [Candidatus Manganitrophus sp.]